MILDLRQSLARECLELWVSAILDLALKECRIPLLVLDLTVHIISVERRVALDIQRGDYRVVGGVQQGIGRRRDALVMQDRIQCVERQARG